MNWNEVSIRLENVSLYDEGTAILDSFDLDFKPSRVTVLLGSSGCGKSTVLKTAAGLCPVSRGNVLYGDQSIYKMNQKDFANTQMKTGFMFQDGALWANMSMKDNLGLPLVIFNPAMEEELLKSKVEQSLGSFGMLSEINSRPAALSSGERKIVSFLRAVISEPDILFLDEPTTFIDRTSSLKLIKHLFDYKKQGKTIILVTHDMNLARSLGDYFVFLNQGKVELYDTVEACMQSDNALWKSFLADSYSEKKEDTDKNSRKAEKSKQEEAL